MKKLTVVLARVLEIPEAEITDDTGPDNVASWDSFNGLLLVSELEEAFDVEFTMEEVTSVKSVRDIKDILNKYGIAILPKLSSLA